MNMEELDQLKDYEWDKFSRRHPVITGSQFGAGFFSRIMLLFTKEGKNVQRMIWENGFLRGIIIKGKENR
jgi:hypothetical protein